MQYQSTASHFTNPMFAYAMLCLCSFEKPSYFLHISQYYPTLCLCYVHSNNNNYTNNNSNNSNSNNNNSYTNNFQIP